jgi:precorrin-6x reductase
MEERRRKNIFCGHVDRCGLSAIMHKNAGKLGKNEDKLQACRNENILT